MKKQFLLGAGFPIGLTFLLPPVKNGCCAYGGIKEISREKPGITRVFVDGRPFRTVVIDGTKTRGESHKGLSQYAEPLAVHHGERSRRAENGRKMKYVLETAALSWNTQSRAPAPDPKIRLLVASGLMAGIGNTRPRSGAVW